MIYFKERLTESDPVNRSFFVAERADVTLNPSL